MQKKGFRVWLRLFEYKICIIAIAAINYVARRHPRFIVASFRMIAEDMVNLNEIARISADYTFRGKIREQAGTSMYAIQIKNVSEEFGLNRESVVQTTLSGKRDPEWPQVGDILLVVRGSRVFATLYDGTFKFSVASPYFFFLVPMLPRGNAWNHPLVDGNKRSGSFPFLWYLWLQSTPAD